MCMPATTLNWHGLTCAQWDSAHCAFKCPWHVPSKMHLPKCLERTSVYKFSGRSKRKICTTTNFFFFLFFFQISLWSCKSSWKQFLFLYPRPPPPNSWDKIVLCKGRSILFPPASSHQWKSMRMEFLALCTVGVHVDTVNERTKVMWSLWGDGHEAAGLICVWHKGEKILKIQVFTSTTKWLCYLSE